MYFPKIIRSQALSFVAGVSFPPLVVSSCTHRKRSKTRFFVSLSTKKTAICEVFLLGECWMCWIQFGFPVGFSNGWKWQGCAEKAQRFTLQLTKTAAERSPVSKNKRNLTTNQQRRFSAYRPTWQCTWLKTRGANTAWWQSWCFGSRCSKWGFVKAPAAVRVQTRF